MTGALHEAQEMRSRWYWGSAGGSGVEEQVVLGLWDLRQEDGVPSA